MVSEPVFVQNTSLDHPVEDDGVILATLLHENEPTKTSLLILDAKNMVEVGRVDFQSEGTVPTSFHGQWARDGDKVHRF